VWQALVIVGSVGVVFGALTLLARRRNAAGIRSGMSARALTVSGLATRTAARKAALKVRSLVSGQAKKRELESRYHLKSAEEVAAVMGQMKGVFMKLGQVASFARESLPPEAKKALESLQSDAPPMSVEGVVRAELGPLGERFSDFEREPMAAASIGQVHRARLKSGEDVVVKVQYPGVDEAITADLRFTQGLVAMGSVLFRNTDTTGMIEEVKARLLDELDYRLEADNQSRFHAIWRDHPLIHVPRVFREHSAKKVLVQERIDGLGFNDFVSEATAEEKRLAMLVMNDFVFDSMHLFGIFNGDPHPGNYLFEPDGRVAFLDFGCVKRFEGPFLDELRALNRAIMARDEARFEAALRRTGIILEGRPYDREASWRFFDYHARPFARDAEFAFTSDYLLEAGEVMKVDNIKRFNLPRDLVFFNRITFGLNAIFARLDARENFHRYYRRYLYPEEDVPPALAHVGVELPSHFLPARRWTITG
ncbi:MAG TPA: AarF/ABC1/UbiB kinase family protein, partial [Myxococcota bacterium]|nr:AarF/ABC1/UbiB kinase family protein [Myxococcota bacterium]